ncbi:hypothetical protein VTK26DRAFT_5225 [Humicola hyalothermophila]
MVLLDFLYPKGTAALLRRPYPMHAMRLEQGSSSRRPIARFLTSAPPRRKDEASHAPAVDDMFVMSADQAAELEMAYREKAVRGDTGFSDPDSLRRLLKSDRDAAYERIYQLYKHLDPSVKGEFTTEVLLTMSSTSRPVEAWRVNELFALYDVNEWTEEIVRAAIKAQLILDNEAEALSIFRTAVQERRFGRAFDYLAAYGLENGSYDMVFEAWSLFITVKDTYDYAPELRVTPTLKPSADSPTVKVDRPVWERPPTGSVESVEQSLIEGNGSAFDSAVARDAKPAGPSSPGDVESAVASRTLQNINPAPKSTVEQNSKPPVESEPLQDFPPGTDPDMARDIEVVVTTTVDQDAEVQNGSATVQFGEVSAEVAISQDTEETLDDQVESQAPEFETVAAPVQDGEGVGTSMAEDFQPATLPLPSQISNGTPDSKTEHSQESTAAERSAHSELACPRVAAIADFETKMKGLLARAEEDADRFPERQTLVYSFIKFLTTYSLELFQPPDAIFLIDRAKDPRAYEQYILLSVEQDRKKMAIDLYKRYRVLPGVRVPDSVLRALMDVFYPHNVRGMEQLLQDWYRGYGRLDEKSYRKYMGFYADRGDVKSLERLAKEYAKHYDNRVREDPNFINTLMRAHAVRGDPAATKRVMDEAVSRTGERPSLQQWAIILDAYCEASDYESAIHLFLQICEEHEPDQHTFGSIMSFAARRGDLQFTLELLRLAKERNVPPTVRMMNSVIAAYCNNDRYPEAEQLCIRLSKTREMEGDYTSLWNTLLGYHSRRRDLTTVNRLLELMTTEGVQYNQDTYSELLWALLNCRQSHHAMHLLNVAHEEGIFEPTPDHYIILMTAFLRSGEPHMALKTNEFMARKNFPEAANRMMRVIDALGRWKKIPKSKRLGLDSRAFFRKIMREFYKALDREDKGAAENVRAMTGLYSKVLFILTQMREFATVEQIIELHNIRNPDRAGLDAIPIRLLNNIMLADYYEKKFDRVKKTWNLVLARATERYRSAKDILENEPDTCGTEPLVLRAQRFRLSDPLKTMQRMYQDEEDAEGLMKLIATVRARGFELDSKNWNYYVQGLARLKKWRDAFSICENVLMPQWTGWELVRLQESGGRLPLALRRYGQNPHRPRPIAHTLLTLAKEYMDLEQLGLWSHDASKEFEWITTNCPRTIRAVTTMIRSGTRTEAEIFGDEVAAPVMEYGKEEEPGNQERQGEEETSLAPEAIKRAPRGRWAKKERKRRELEEKERREQAERERFGEGGKLGPDVWTEGGFLNAPGPASAPEKRRNQDGLADDDIVAAIKGEGGEDWLREMESKKKEKEKEKEGMKDAEVGEEWEVTAEEDESENVRYHDMWSDDGSLNAPEKMPGNRDLSEEDIVAMIKGEEVEEKKQKKKKR